MTIIEVIYQGGVISSQLQLLTSTIIECERAKEQENSSIIIIEY